jgi:hypothetical protein
MNTSCASLSGGNIQNVILAREITRKPKALLAAYPIRKLDIGASEYVHDQLIQGREEGMAVLLISEELDELLDLCDRIAGANPFRAYSVMFTQSLSGIFGITEMMVRAAPLMLFGLGIAIAFRSGILNIGGGIWGGSRLNAGLPECERNFEHGNAQLHRHSSLSVPVARSDDRPERGGLRYRCTADCLAVRERLAIP